MNTHSVNIYRENRQRRGKGECKKKSYIYLMRREK
jgi:hypothetical protein